MLKIAIDLTSLYNRKITGIEAYATDLYEALLEKENIILYPVFRHKNTLDNHPDSIILKSKNRVIVEQWLFPLLVYKMNFDIVLYPAFPPGYLTYFLSKKSNIIPVIHDIAMWKYPNTLSKGARFYLKPLYNLALKKSKKLITITETSKAALEEMTPAKIINFSEGISKIYSNTNNTHTDICSRLDLDKEGYILSVSTIEPRKNLKYLLEVYKSLIHKEFNKKLVLVGRKGWGKDVELNKMIRDLSRHIVFSDYISNEDLITLYKNCYAFWLFSIHEGFGRPPLEALACGSKVFVSDIPVFREVLKDRVTYLPLGEAHKAAEIILSDHPKKNNSPLNPYSFENFKIGLTPESLQ